MSLILSAALTVFTLKPHTHVQVSTRRSWLTSRPPSAARWPVTGSRTTSEPPPWQSPLALWLHR